MKNSIFRLINALYSLMMLALLLLIINYFTETVSVPQTVIVIVLVLSAIIFSGRMYLRFSGSRKS
jgi:uncharacterized membrane protein YgdD (TMEM256/DUF423 family)